MPTSCEIYQTYLRGPAALIRLFEQALGTQASMAHPTRTCSSAALRICQSRLT